MINQLVCIELSIEEWVTIMNAIKIMNYYDPLEGLELNDISDLIRTQLDLEFQQKKEPNN